MGAKVKGHESCLCSERSMGAKVPWNESSWTFRSPGANVPRNESSTRAKVISMGFSLPGTCRETKRPDTGVKGSHVLDVGCSLGHICPNVQRV